MKKSIKSTDKTRTLRAKRTGLGRFLCRSFGDRTGGILMEYVLLGLLVVAAVAAAVIMFGKSIKSGLTTMSKTTTADMGAARQAAAAGRTLQDSDETQAEVHRTAIELE